MIAVNPASTTYERRSRMSVSPLAATIGLAAVQFALTAGAAK
jgi:hypothetical protein